MRSADSVSVQTEIIVWVQVQTGVVLGQHAISSWKGELSIPLLLRAMAARSYGNPLWQGNIGDSSYHDVEVWCARQEGSRGSVSSIVNCFSNVSTSCLKCKGIQVGGPNSSPNKYAKELIAKVRTCHWRMEDDGETCGMDYSLLLYYMGMPVPLFLNLFYSGGLPLLKKV